MNAKLQTYFDTD